MAVVLQETLRAPFYAPFYAALVFGAYRQEGVEVEFRSATSRPADAATALFTGSADASWGGPMRVMLTYDRDPDADLVCFCGVVMRDPFFLVGRTPRPDFRLSDLAGTRLGIVAEVPTPWLCLQQDIRDQGLDPSTFDRDAGLSMPENAAALRAGARDVVQLPEPFVTQLLREKAGHIWYSPASRGPTAYTSFYARRGTLAARRDELLGMTRAIDRTLKWIQDAPPGEIGRALSGFFPDLDAGDLCAAMARYQGLNIWPESPVLTREGYDRLKTSIVSGGLVKAGQPFEAIVDNSLAATAAAENLPPLQPM